jgi:hypothetical protein
VYPSPQTLVKALPEFWVKDSVTLEIKTNNDTHYTFSAASSVNREKKEIIGVAPVSIVSGGTGPYSGM